MFGDSVFDEEDDRPPKQRERSFSEDDSPADEDGQVMAFGGLDERLRRREAVAQLLREVGGC